MNAFREHLRGDGVLVRYRVWFVVVVWEGNEAKVAEKFGEDNFYYPKLVKWHKPRRRKKGDPARVPKSFPLLPGFLFFSGDVNGKLLRDRKVIGVLGVAGEPGIVRDSELDAIRIAEASGDFDETRNLFSGIVGSNIEIVTGAFAGKTAHVDGIVGGNVVLSFGKRSHPVLVPLSKLAEIRQEANLGLPGLNERSR